MADDIQEPKLDGTDGPKEPGNEAGSQPGPDYIGVISDLKKNTVPKESYEKLMEENQKLLKAFAEGRNLPEEMKQKEDPNVEEMRKDLFGKDHTNLEYVSKTLEMREAIMAKGEPDPFLPYGKNISPTQEDVEAAERVAEVLKHCVDYAEGDPQVFTNELQRLTVESSPIRKRR